MNLVGFNVEILSDTLNGQSMWSKEVLISHVRSFSYQLNICP